MAEALGASFSIDITDLKAGLAAANRAIKETNSEWQAAAAGMDDASGSAEGLEANQKRLNKIIPIQQEKVRALTAEYDRLIEEGLDPTSKQASDMRVKINKATEELNKSEKQLKDTTEALENMNDASEKGGKGMSSIGSIAKGAAVGVAAITAAAVAAVAGFIGLAESTREARTELAKLKQNADSAGVGFEQVQDKISDVTSVTGDAGAAMEGLNMLMATGLDTSQIEYAADALTGASMKFDGLNFEAMSEGLQESLAVGEAVGGFAELIERNGDSLEAFNAGLAECSTEAEKQQYVMDYLSKSGLKELNDSYKENNADLVAANEAAYNMEQTMNDLGAIAEPISTIFKNMGATLLQGVIPYVEKLAGAFQALAGGDVEGGLGQITAVLDEVATAAEGLVVQLVEKVSELAPIILPKVAELIGNIAARLGEMAPVLIPQIVGLVSTLVQTLVGLAPTILSAAAQLFLGLVQAIPPTITLLLAELPKIVESILSALSEAIPIILDAAEQALGSIVDALPSVLASLGENLPKILQKIIDFLVNSLPTLLDKAVDFLMSVVRAIPTIVSALAQNLPKIVMSITGTLLKNAPSILSAAVKMLWKIIEAVPQIAGELLGQAPQIIGSIVKGLAGGYQALFDAGKDMLKGLWEGMKSLGDWIWDKISGFFNKTIVGGIKKLLGIASPSKVFAQLGAFSAQGYAEGFEDSMDEAKKGIVDAMDFDTPDPHGGGTGGSGGTRPRRGDVYFTQNNYSPKALSRAEIYRQTKNAAGLIPQGG